MKILCIGDICQSGGMDIIRRKLHKIRKEYGVDLIIANGENSNEGNENGISRASAGDIFAYGADIITTGNHSFSVKGIDSAYEDMPYLLRPANMPPETPGRGYCIYDMGRTAVGVINLIGNVYMHGKNQNPFREADRIIEEIKDKVSVIIVDFHAEATAEKLAMGYYLDGRVTAVFGTHTHVQTNDAHILARGTAYITDVGMTGPAVSVLGIDKDVIIDRFANDGNAKFVPAGGKTKMDCILIETDATGKAISIKSMQIE